LRGEEKRVICDALQEIEFALLDELRRAFEEGRISEFWEAIPQIRPCHTLVGNSSFTRRSGSETLVQTETCY